MPSPFLFWCAIRFTTPFTPTIRRYLSLPKTGGYRPEGFVSTASTSEKPTMKPSTSQLTSNTSNKTSSKPKDAVMTESELMVLDDQRSKMKEQIREMREANKGKARDERVGGEERHREERRDRERDHSGDNGERRERERDHSGNGVRVNRNEVNFDVFSSNAQIGGGGKLFNPSQSQSGNHGGFLSSSTSTSIYDLQKSSHAQNDVFKQFAGGFAKFNKKKEVPPPTVSAGVFGDETKERERDEERRHQLKKSASQSELKLQREDRHHFNPQQPISLSGSSSSNELGKEGREREERKRHRTQVLEPQTERIVAKEKNADSELNHSTSSSPSPSSSADITAQDEKKSKNPSEKIAMRLAAAVSANRLQNPGPVRHRTNEESDGKERSIEDSNPVNLSKTPGGGMKAMRVTHLNPVETTTKKPSAGRVLSKEPPIGQPVFKTLASKDKTLVLGSNSTSNFDLNVIPTSAPPKVESSSNPIEKTLEIIDDVSAGSTPSGSPKGKSKESQPLPKPQIKGLAKKNNLKAGPSASIQNKLKGKVGDGGEQKKEFSKSTSSSVVKDNKVLTKAKPSVNATSKSGTGFVPTTRKVNSTSSTSKNPIVKQPLKASTNQQTNPTVRTVSNPISKAPIKPVVSATKDKVQPSTTTTSKPPRAPLHAPKPSNVRSKVESTSFNALKSSRATSGGFLPKGKITSSISNRNLNARNLALGKNGREVLGVKKVDTNGKEKVKVGISKVGAEIEGVTAPAGNLKNQVKEGTKSNGVIGKSRGVEKVEEVEKISIGLPSSTSDAASVSSMVEKKLDGISVNPEAVQVQNHRVQTEQVFVLDQEMEKVEIEEKDSIKEVEVAVQVSSRPKAMRIPSSEIEESEDEGEKDLVAKVDEIEVVEEEKEIEEEVQDRLEEAQENRLLSAEVEAETETETDTEPQEEVVDSEKAEEIREAEQEPEEVREASQIEDRVEPNGPVEENLDLRDKTEVVEQPLPVEEVVMQQHTEEVQEEVRQPFAEIVEDQGAELEDVADESTQTVKHQSQEVSIDIPPTTIDESSHSIKISVPVESEKQAEHHAENDAQPDLRTETQIEEVLEPAVQAEEKQLEVDTETIKEQPQETVIDVEPSPQFQTSSSKQDFFISRNQVDGKTQLVCGPRPSEAFSDSANTDLDDVPTSPIRETENLKHFKTEEDPQEQTFEDQIQMGEEGEEDLEDSISQPKMLLRRNQIPNVSSRSSLAESVGDDSSIFEDDSVLLL